MKQGLARDSHTIMNSTVVYDVTPCHLLHNVLERVSATHYKDGILTLTCHTAWRHIPQDASFTTVSAQESEISREISTKPSETEEVKPLCHW